MPHILTATADGPSLNQLGTPPRPLILIPFSRDVDFIERGTILERIRQKCSAPGARTALVGLGGVGKSQLAIEHVYRIREQSPDTWVFWVHASNAARFEQSFRGIADRADIPSRKDPAANILQLVYEWLSDERNGKWVIILDNADDGSFLFKAVSTTEDDKTTVAGVSKSQPLLLYLPHDYHGTILVTSRSSNAVARLVERGDIIHVGPMESIDALQLFEKKCGGHNDKDVSVELVTALEYMPLAIVQAAAYISQRVPRYSVSQYLEDFKKSDCKRTSLLNHKDGHLRRDREAKNSIIITWQISFEHIRETRSFAADLLSLMSFFDRQGIPEALLRRKEKNQDENTDDDDADADVMFAYGDGASDSDDLTDSDSRSSMSTEDFDQDIVTLRDYHLVSANLDGTTFEMHRLVQLATREWLKVNQQQERWKQQFIKNLNAELPTGEYENWATCQALFPHAQAALAQKPESQGLQEQWATVLYKAGWYAWQMGRGEEAEKLSVQAWKTRRKGLGCEHEDTLDSMAMVGLIYQLRGRWDAAEELQVRVLETSKAKLGPDHPDTLSSINNLALTYSEQGRLDAAEELQVQVMKMRKTKLGADHLKTLTSMVSLASTYRGQGRWDAAEELQVRVMDMSKTKLGPHHPDTLRSINNLATIYMYQRRWDAAEELQVQVVEMRKTKLGADHPNTLTSMANLAATYRKKGRWNAAEELAVQVLEISKTKLGADHPDTLSSMAGLAATYHNQGRWNAAEELEVQVMEMSKKKLGADHPDTLTSMNNLAFTWKEKGQRVQAISLLEACIQSRRRILGSHHIHTLSSCSALAAWKEEAQEVEYTAIKGKEEAEVIVKGQALLQSGHYIAERSRQN